MHDIEIIKKELPVDLLEFFYPHAAARLGGSSEAVHRPAWRWTPDLNKYDLNHVTTAHPRMSREEWAARLPHGVGATYYTNEHVESVLRRMVATSAAAPATLSC